MQTKLYHKIIYSEKKLILESSKVAAAKKLFFSAYIIGATCFD